MSLTVLAIASVYDAIILIVILGFGVAWLANRPQPAPHPELWRLNEERRQR